MAVSSLIILLLCAVLVVFAIALFYEENEREKVQKELDKAIKYIDIYRDRINKLLNQVDECLDNEKELINDKRNLENKLIKENKIY